MPRHSFLLALVLPVALLGACSKPPPPADPPQPQAKAEHIASPLDPLLEKEQRAKDVQKTVDDQAKAQKAAIDAASQ
jgi:hypothetical protein